MLFLAIWALCAAGVVFLVYAVWASTFDLRKVADIPERTAVYDYRGRPYSRLAGENREVVGWSGISPEFVRALLAREDSRFYDHRGIDPVGIARALVRNLLHFGVKEGGSTITQQLALNTFLGGRHVRSIHRKLLEAFLAVRIEENFSKRQILEYYANRIYFGSGVYGIETASRMYFGKSASRLTLAEGAMLAGIIRSPNRLSPHRNPAGATRERARVLDRMAALGMIALAEADLAKNSPVRPVPPQPLSAQENYALDLIQGELETIMDEKQIEEGGLKIYTTIDPVLQEVAEKQLDARLAEIEKRPGFAGVRREDARLDLSGTNGGGTSDGVPYIEGALIAIDNATGGVRAIAGGRDYRESRYNRAWVARRQVGSTFKPFVYAAAVDAGLDPRAPISDDPLRAGEVRGVARWSPGNSDKTNRGMLPAVDGLVFSRNTMTVRVGERAGLHRVREVAGRAGLGDLPRHPSVYLGAFEASVRDITSAYTVFANSGVRRQVFIIDRIEDALGSTVYRSARVKSQAMVARTADAVAGMLEQVLDRGTGVAARDLGFRGYGAGKTGTTDGFRDAWFVGFNRSITCGVWVGFDRPQTIMEEGYGGVVALPIWADFMKATQQAGATAGQARPEASPRRGVLDPFRRIFGR